MNISQAVSQFNDAQIQRDRLLEFIKILNTHDIEFDPAEMTVSDGGITKSILVPFSKDDYLKILNDELESIENTIKPLAPMIEAANAAIKSTYMGG